MTISNVPEHLGYQSLSLSFIIAAKSPCPDGFDFFGRADTFVRVAGVTHFGALELAATDHFVVECAAAGFPVFFFIDRFFKSQDDRERSTRASKAESLSNQPRLASCRIQQQCEERSSVSRTTTERLTNRYATNLLLRNLVKYLILSGDCLRLFQR